MTQLEYVGNVNIQIKGKNYKKHNRGTSHLFELFASFLTSEVSSFSGLPAYLAVYEANVEEVLLQPVHSAHTKALNELVHTQQYVDIVRDQHIAVFTAMITNAHLASVKPVEAGTQLTLALVARNGTAILAAVPLEPSIYNIITSGGQALIEWTMTLVNSTIS